MKNLLFTFLIFSFSKNVDAQIINERKVVKGFNINVFGNASVISANYERNFIVSDAFTVAANIGLGFNTEFRLCFGGCSLTDKYLTIPHFVTGNLGRKKEFFEFGAGGAFLLGKEKIQYVPFALLGYRLQALQFNNGYFRFTLSMPFYGWGEKDIIFIPVGISLGKSF